MYFIDRGRPDGWYAYRISAIDIFGRHSAQSASGGVPMAPAPDRGRVLRRSPADRVLHPEPCASSTSYRRLRPGVEAFALDPDDPTCCTTPLGNMFNSLTALEKTAVIGLRVRWRWPVAAQRQAPTRASSACITNRRR